MWARGRVGAWAHGCVVACVCACAVSLVCVLACVCRVRDGLRGVERGGMCCAQEDAGKLSKSWEVIQQFRVSPYVIQGSGVQGFCPVRTQHLSYTHAVFRVQGSGSGANIASGCAPHAMSGADIAPVRERCELAMCARSPSRV